MTKKVPLIIESLSVARLLLQARPPYTEFKGKLFDAERIVDKSVEGNIFRTFGGLPEKPSYCYRHWGRSIYSRLRAALESAQSQQDYNSVVQDFAGQLAVAWRDTMNSKLPYGPATKMINLLIKTMFLTDQIELRSLPQWYNVPFDSFTLVPLISIIDELLSGYSFGIPMNRYMTMNYVICEEQYHHLQQAVRVLCVGTTRTPLDYELWAWDSQH